jgi:hypothetical protein
MTSMTKAKPAMPPPIDGTPYKEQRIFDLKCLDGADTGQEVTYKVGSLGGLNAVLDLLDRVHEQLRVNPKYSCPVLTLGTDYYDHQKWGRIYTPVLEIVGWADINGNLAQKPGPHLAADPAPVAAAASAKPARQRKPPVAAAPETAPAAPQAPAEPVPTAQAHVGQRRRPNAR